MQEVIFDLETKSFFTDTGNSDASQLGASVVSVYVRELDDAFSEVSGQMYSFWEPQFPDMWKFFREADRIIGFNTVNFDIPVLKPYAPSDFPKFSHFDIYQKIKEVNDGRAASLNAIAKDTLERGKIDSGANAVNYWQKGDPESLALLKKYCEADVLLTRDIYDFGLKQGYLKFTDRWNNSRVVKVDFSYPADLVSQKQISFF